jgi:hypothetical protein
MCDAVASELVEEIAAPKTLEDGFNFNGSEKATGTAKS